MSHQKTEKWWEKVKKKLFFLHKGSSSNCNISIFLKNPHYSFQFFFTDPFNYLDNNMVIVEILVF